MSRESIRLFAQEDPDEGEAFNVAREFGFTEEEFRVLLEAESQEKEMLDLQESLHILMLVDLQVAPPQGLAERTILRIKQAA